MHRDKKFGSLPMRCWYRQNYIIGIKCLLNIYACESLNWIFSPFGRISSINFLIIFHHGWCHARKAASEEKLSQLWLFMHRKRRRKKMFDRWGRKKVAWRRPSWKCNFKHGMQQFHLFPAHNNAHFRWVGASRGKTKFLMQFSVRVKFTGKRQFP